MELALLVLRVVVGVFFVGHGAQKLWGSFGGHGLQATAGFFDSIGMKPGRRNALAAGWGEVIGGALLILGLLTPLAAAIIIAVMLVAITTVHLQNGPWATENGYEYNAVLIAVAFALAGTGPGQVSLDDALGWMTDITGAGWAFAALAAGALGALGAHLAAGSARGRSAPAPGSEPVAATASADDARFARDDEDAVARRERPGVPADPR